MPRNDTQKLSRFAREAMHEAVGRAATLRAELDADRRRMLAQGDAAIRAEAAQRLSDGRKELGRQISRELSTHTLKMRETLLRRREEIVATITDDVRGRLTAFADSAEYYPWLLSLCQTVAETYPLSFTVSLAERDAHLVDALRGALPASAIADIVLDPAIRLGGARFYAEENHLLINQTFDDSLTRSRDMIIRLLGPVSLEGNAGRNGGTQHV